MNNNQGEINIEENDELIIKKNFFDAIKNENITEIVKYFRNEKLEVWMYKEENEYTALHRATFLNFTLIICTMIDEMRIRLGIEAKREIKKWINERTNQGNTALSYASFKGNIEIINKLIENGAEIEVINTRGLNVLHMAAQGNQPNALIYFKEKYSMNIQSIDEFGSTPLHWACYTGSETSVIFLLSWNVNVNSQDNEGLTPLHLAVLSERTRIVKKLLQKGANKKIKDKKGRTPSDLALAKNKLSIVEMLKGYSNCQLFVMRAPLEKVHKSSFNIIFFFFMHLFVESSVFLGLLPFINSQFLALTYACLLFLVFTIYITLICSDPGELRKEENQLLVKLVEDKVNIAIYCPICHVEKKSNSRHCIICDKCIEGFDHHCYWVNNCIGNGNLTLFIIFLVHTIINILFNIIIAILCLVTHCDHFDYSNTFPPALLWANFYNDSARRIISSCIIITGIIFLFPLIILLFVQVKNILKRTKKTHSNKRSSLIKNRKSLENKSMLTKAKDDFLLKNEDNVLIIENMRNSK